MNHAKLLVMTISITIMLSFTVTPVLVLADSEEEIKEEKAEIRKMAKETLGLLYDVRPSAQKAISDSAG
ncbi:MAG: hypothetical protein QNJ58_24785 [Desulfobacterales bacterium]|nr:hypothetical protein [Desulfobacterales bacterium]